MTLIEPYYPKAGNDRRPYPLAVMLRIYFFQQWYQLSDPGAEEALYDFQSMRAFAGLELGRDAIPDDTTILNVRHLEAHDLTTAIFEAVSSHLEDKGALLRGGTIMDATLIAALSWRRHEPPCMTFVVSWASQIPGGETAEFDSSTSSVMRRRGADRQRSRSGVIRRSATRRLAGSSPSDSTFK